MRGHISTGVRQDGTVVLRVAFVWKGSQERNLDLRCY